MLALYVSESKRYEEHEKDGARHLSNETQHVLTYRAANRLISPERGGPAKRDVVHLIISMSAEQFERLRKSENKCRAAPRKATREAMKEIERATKVKSLLWFAGIHRNTRPHVHVVVGRADLDDDILKEIKIKHLPRALLPHHETTQDDQREFVQGQIATHFIETIEIIQ